MPRAATTEDEFNAIAEPRRRQLLEALGGRELPVNALVERLGWPQPMISKHLAVLKKVGLVSERRAGRQRLYRINAERLKPIHDWVMPFQRFWEESYERLDEYLDRAQEKKKGHGRSGKDGSGQKARARTNPQRGLTRGSRG